MNNLTVGKKISLVCIALLLLGAVQGMVSLVTGNRTADAVQLAATDSVPSLSTISLLSGFAKDQRAEATLHLFVQAAEERREHEKQISDLEAKLQERITGTDKELHGNRRGG